MPDLRGGLSLACRPLVLPDENVVPTAAVTSRA